MIIDLRKNFYLFLFSALVLCTGLFFPQHGSAQLSYHVGNMALGGGGTAYSTGSEALFLNPANLLIKEKDHKISISLLQGSSFLNGININREPLNHFTDLKVVFTLYDPVSEMDQQALTVLEKEQIVDRNFREDLTKQTFKAHSEFHWFGIKWFGEENAYALSLRTRAGNRFTLGRGLFSDDIVENGGKLMIDRSLEQNYQIQHELSFGYSESFTFLNGIQPKPSTFLIGIAPKIIIPGSGLHVNATNQTFYQPERAAWIQETAFVQRSSGVLSDQNLASQTNTGTGRMFSHPENQTSFFDLLKPTGIGLGLDIGMTYHFTFGDDLSLLKSDKGISKQSVRLSLSLTDLGAVFIRQNPSEVSDALQTSESSRSGNGSDYIYGGAPNEHYFFLNRMGVQIPQPSLSDDQDPLTAMLPASIQTGALFHYHWFKLMADASYSMADSAFRHTGLVSYLGTEIRPFHFLPLRAGTRFGKNLPPLLSFGTGIELENIELNAAFMLQNDDLSDSFFSGEIAGVSLLGVRIHL